MKRVNSNGRQFKWKAIQTYKDKTVVKWTDDNEDSETPAPVTKVKDVDEEEQEEAPSTGGQTALWIVSILALIVSTVALFKHRNLTKTDK